MRTPALIRQKPAFSARHHNFIGPKPLKRFRDRQGQKKNQHVCKANDVAMVSFPKDYREAVRQAQAAVKAALADGELLLEVEFPAAGLASVSGDGEGGNEMTYSLGYLRQFCRIFQDNAPVTRIFFPDQKEMWLASGRNGDEDAAFASTAFQLDHLTRPSFLHDIGLGALDRIDASQNIRPEDQAFVIAYPHFNIGEMVAVEEIYAAKIKGTERPLVVFNGELDRIRSGYYPAVFYPGLAKMAREWLPSFCQAYYIHNFKGRKPGYSLVIEFPPILRDVIPKDQ